MTAPIVKVVVTNKLPATGFAEVFLLVVAGFAVSLYILSTATGTANGNLNLHNSNIPCLRCFLFALRLSAYILGHHRIFNQMPDFIKVPVHVFVLLLAVALARDVRLAASLLNLRAQFV